MCGESAPLPRPPPQGLLFVLSGEMESMGWSPGPVGLRRCRELGGFAHGLL